MTGRTEGHHRTSAPWGWGAEVAGMGTVPAVSLSPAGTCQESSTCRPPPRLPKPTGGAAAGVGQGWGGGRGRRAGGEESPADPSLSQPVEQQRPSPPGLPSAAHPASQDPGPPIHPPPGRKPAQSEAEAGSGPLPARADGRAERRGFPRPLRTTPGVRSLQTEKADVGPLQTREQGGEAALPPASLPTPRLPEVRQGQGPAGAGWSRQAQDREG